MMDGMNVSDACEHLDPRVQEELEKLNSTTDQINTLETQLDDANAAFRSTLSESTQKLNLLGKKLGKCIEKARPYYDAKEIARQAQVETQKAAVQYQRANSVHMAAKETIMLAEEKFLSRKQEWEFDNAWQEMLNHATMKVMEAETMKRENETEHQKRAAMFTAAENKVQILERRLKRGVMKSRPYFEMKSILQKNLEKLKDTIQKLQVGVTMAKRKYADSLHNLEAISEEIHERRRLSKLKFREPGVGAELPMQLPDIMLDKFDMVGQGSMSTSDFGSEVDDDDDAASHITEDSETENLRRDLTELSQNMEAAAISANHHTETYLRRTSLSHADQTFHRWQQRPSSGSGSSQPDLYLGISTETKNDVSERSQDTTKDVKAGNNDDAKSFVSVDLND